MTTPGSEPSQIPADSPPPDAAARVHLPPSTPIGGDLAQERPELVVAGAFVGAFLVAKILRRIGS